jgi:hypothetical protein
MRRYAWSGLLAAVAAIAATTISTHAADTDLPVTFARDVLPILQKNCQSCHRPGQIAPMSLLTYEEARPWARSIKTKVESRQMPPWFADSQHGQFANDRSLSQRDIDTLVKWADGGAPRGNDAEAPSAVQWPTDGWQVKPDLIVRGPEFRVPARPEKNVIEWTTMIIPSGFTKDTWVTSMEIKPSDLSVTHHICITFQPHRPNVKYYVLNWQESPRDEDGVAVKETGREAPPPNARPGAGAPGAGAGTGTGGGFFCYVPGVQADDYRPYGAAKLIPANSDISFQAHYTPIGKEVVDRPLIGFTVADTPPEKQWISYGISAGGPKFAIPPNDGNYLSPPVDVEFTTDVELVQMMPHMHLRGKDMTYHLIYPDGRDEVILNVPKYDFNWQIVYQPVKPIRVPKGVRLHVDAHYNNSTSNKFNPDPSRTVYIGRMTWEEMMAPFFGVVVPRDVNAATVLKRGNFVLDSGA